jgi:hypothetical protein
VCVSLLADRHRHTEPPQAERPHTLGIGNDHKRAIDISDFLFSFFLNFFL